MSQREVLEILLAKTNNQATLAEMVKDYNYIHFPRNYRFHQYPQQVVRKTMQHDIAKLLRDRMITKQIVKTTYERKIIFTLTEYGKIQVGKDRLHAVQLLHNL